jgi:hypothetical protein
MKPVFGCILAIAGWYLLYPPATQKGGPDSEATLSSWVIDSSYGTAEDCDAAHYGDLNTMPGLQENSHHDNAFLQTQAGRCIAAYDPCLAK